LTVIEEKNAYPYITEFKKEPFKSFLLLEQRDIDSFYFSQYDKIITFFQYYSENLFKIPNLNLENIYWFLLLKKYLKESLKPDLKNQIYDFVTKCEEIKDDTLGFNFSPHSTQKVPDMWSTYFALANLKLIGRMKEFFSSKGEEIVKREVGKFVTGHKKEDQFLHCLEKNCEICEKTTPARTLYFALEILNLLGVDVRFQKHTYLEFLQDRKKDPSLVFKLLCIKQLQLDYEVYDKELEYFHQFQKENGGYSFNKIKGRINTTFWIVYLLDSFSWLKDYNPSGVFTFINLELNRIIADPSSWDSLKLMEISKLVILLSIIWKKFIGEIERVIFRRLGEENYIDLKQIENAFGLFGVVEEIVSYINLNYTFNLKIVDNIAEFKNFLRNVKPSEKIIAKEIFTQVQNKSIISVSDLMKKYNTRIKDMKILIDKMIEKNFFEGSLKMKKKFLFITKYYLYLDFFLENIIVADTKINCEILYEEKEKLDDIKNDIYNMTLKLKQASQQIKSEIESYLLIDEIDIAKERLRFILMDTLMEADFLNENIENSFNEELYYVNLQAALGNEIDRWNKLYSILSKKLTELESSLRKRIEEKEKIQKFDKILDQLESRLSNIEQYFNKRLDDFRNYLSEIFQDGYSDYKFGLVTEEFNKISESVKKYDNIIYKVSQQITSKEEKLNRKHKKLINYWIGVKESLDNTFDYYVSGFQFFKNKIDQIEEIREETKENIESVSKKTKEKIQQNEFKEAFSIIKDESDIILEITSEKIKKVRKEVKKEIKAKQKLYLLFQYLNEKLEGLEATIFDDVSSKVQSLKNKVTEGRNKVIIEDFDQFVGNNVNKIRTELENYQTRLNRFDNFADLEIKKVKKDLDIIYEQFEDIEGNYEDKLENCRDLIQNFDEKSKLSIIQWKKFREYISNEIEILKEDYTKRIIKEKIIVTARETGTDSVSLKDIAKDLDLKCKDVINRLKNMIEISNFSGKINENDKYVLVFTDYYYKNKELLNYVDNSLLKYHNETVGKIIALYESCIKNRTMSVNLLEITNRLNDLKDFETNLRKKFNKKVEELDIQINKRKEYQETKEHFENLIENATTAIKNISEKLKLFKKLQNIIFQEYNELKIEITQKYNKIQNEIDSFSSHTKIRDYFDEKKQKLDEKIQEINNKIEEKIEENTSKEDDSHHLLPEIREIYVNQKKTFLGEIDERVRKLNNQILLRKDEIFRERLMKFINQSKIGLSQLLGTLQARVEDDIEIKEFKRAHQKIEKRSKNIQTNIKNLKKELEDLLKTFNKESRDFTTKNKYLLDDFFHFLNEFDMILSEKVKTLEKLILKAYIEMAIKAVANEYLTLSFLNSELKIKKQDLQDYLLSLIGSDELKGKYDPRIGIYYENEEILENIDEEELEVIKKMNYRVFIFLNRLKNFTTHYYSIIAFFASILTITYYLFLLTGQNPLALIFPILLSIIVGAYFLIKKRKKEKMKLIE
jgi:hypothetical protein